MTNELGRKSRTGLLWDMLGNIIRQISLLAVTVVLARLLSPEEFGLVGMAAVFMALAQVFIDVGFTDAIIQSKEINDYDLSSVFFANLVLSFVVGGVVFLLAQPIAQFYENQAIVPIVQALAIVPMISSVGKVHAALLTKQMNFKALSIRNIASTLVGGGIGIAMAYRDFGTHALVAQQIVAALTGSVLLWIGSGWKPMWHFSYSNVKGLLSFSSYVFFDQLLRQFFLKLDTLFIGKVFSPAMLGFYSRAESLNAQVSNYTSTSLRKIMFPVLSSVQDEPEKFKRYFFQAFHIASFTGVLTAGVLYFMAEDIILNLLGEQWEPSIVIFKILVFRLFFLPFGPLMGKAMLSKGYSKEKFRLSQFLRFLLLAPMLSGYFFGIHLFTITLVAVGFINVLISMGVISRLFKYSFLDMFYSLTIALLPLIVILIFKSIFEPICNGIFLTIVFVLLQIVFSVITRDKGYLFFMQQLEKLFFKKA